MLSPRKLLFVFLAIFSFLSSPSQSQEISTGKQLLGTVIFKTNVFNYTLRDNNNNTYAFQLERVTGTVSSVESSKMFFGRLTDTFSLKNKDWKLADSVSINKLIAKAQTSYIESISERDSANAKLDSVSLFLNRQGLISSDSATKVQITNLVTQINDFIAANKSVSPAGENHSLNSLTENVYQSILKDDFTKWGLYSKADDNDVKKLAEQLYNEIQVRLKFKDDEPVTAYLKLKSDVIPIYYGTDETLLTEMKVINIQFEFEEGTIKNIYAELNKEEINGIDGKFEFRNNKPISISGKYDPGLYDEQQIFSYQISNTQKQKLKNYLKIDKSKNDKLNENIYFRLGDVMKYLLVLENRKEDYSPADCKVDLSPQNPLITLKKQLRSKILTVKAFSDFNGINSEAPNGLVQLEATIGANLITRRFQGLFNYWPYDWYTGFFTRIELTGILSKIEENNRYMVLDGSFLNKDSLNAGVKSFNINAINLLKYQNNGINANMYIYKLNIPQAKLNFQLNGSAGILRTGITDSITLDKKQALGYSVSPVRNSRTVTSSNFSLTAQLEFSPENRYGFSIGYRQRYFNPLSPDIARLMGKEKIIYTYMIDGFIATGDNTKLFFRWNLNKLATDPRVNYNQVLLGYVIDVFKTNSK